MREKAFAVVHCTGGDLLIALSSLAIALVVAGERTWPARSFWSIAVLSVLLGLAYTVFSEWLNIVIRRAWEYSNLTPVVSLFQFEVGMSRLYNGSPYRLSRFGWPDGMASNTKRESHDSDRYCSFNRLWRPASCSSGPRGELQLPEYRGAGEALWCL